MAHLSDIVIPDIVITKPNHEALSRFVEYRALAFSQVADFLERELERAKIVDPQDVPRDVVTMNSLVRFRIQPDGISRTITLVYPEKADLMEGRLSVLTPVGVALLGVAAGQSMGWIDRTGDMKTLKVQQVVYQPETGRQPEAATEAPASAD